MVSESTMIIIDGIIHIYHSIRHRLTNVTQSFLSVLYVSNIFHSSRTLQKFVYVERNYGASSRVWDLPRSNLRYGTDILS